MPCNKVEMQVIYSAAANNPACMRFAPVSQGADASRSVRFVCLPCRPERRECILAKVNENYQKLPGSYLFAEIARRTDAYAAAHPEAKLIKMGIGDVTRPLVPAVIDAMHRAVDDMSRPETFHGYGPEQGYDFLREAIAANDFRARGVDIDTDEIFVSDGAKSDTGNIGDILSIDNKVAVCDPVYPVYVDTNAMAGRAGDYDEKTQGWTNICYMPTTAENGFCPAIPDEKVDIIYLCSPNNPTGTVLHTADLQRWVDYANENGSIILFDAAYERFIVEDDVPHSIFEIPGAKTCAIEFRSFSKTAGFTGARCGYTVVPKALIRDGQSLNAMWLRRQTTKFNGASYIIERGAEAVYAPEGARQIEDTLDYYRANARVIVKELTAAGLQVFGGTNSPYIWCQTPGGMGSWDFFDLLLTEANIITTPGAGFGPSGEGYIRLTAFGDADATKEAMERIKRLMDSRA
jgi:LL-diaminopimelate aminotransferase